MTFNVTNIMHNVTPSIGKIRGFLASLKKCFNIVVNCETLCFSA